MRRGAVILSALFLSVAVGGCSLTGSTSASSGSFTGVQGQVAVALNLLSSDASGANAADICKNVFDAAIVKRLGNTAGCTTAVTAQLKTIGDFTLTVKTIIVTGSKATATVQTEDNGTKVIKTVVLRQQSGNWRLASVL
jgi:hypothetical protein